MTKTLDLLSFLNPSQVGFLLDNLETMPTNQMPESVKDLVKDLEDDRAPVWAQKPATKTHTQQPTGVSPTLLQAVLFIGAYKNEGHLLANLDPLQLEKKDLPTSLDPRTYGLSETTPVTGLETFGFKVETVKELIEKLQKTYCGKIGLEYEYIENQEQRRFLQERFERLDEYYAFSKKEYEKIYLKLCQAESFEKFLHVKFPGAKRFGLDGTESLIPALESILEKCVKKGKKRVVFGMAHRGRLNVLVNLLNKPMSYFFSKFQDDALANDYGMGDVKYHLGHEATRKFDGQDLDVSLVYNPSHLEAVNPVALGKVRAYQDLLKDESRSKVLGVLIHGDAAFAGQGIVLESLQLADIPAYTTGGTFHVVINNQIGFTTNPRYS